MIGSEPRSPRVQLVSANRLPLESPDQLGSNRSLVPRSLALLLYDAKESQDVATRERWELFCEVVGGIVDLGAAASISARYDRAAEQASLEIIRNGEERSIVPLILMGSGMQQIACLVGHLLMAGGSIMAVEEPEINLRYERQLLLRDALNQIVLDTRGPSQLFLSSHSPAFESSGPVYCMKQGTDGPSVSLRPAGVETVELTGMSMLAHPVGAQGARSRG